VSFDPTNPVSRCFAPSGSWDHRYCSFLHFEYLPIAEATATSFAAPLFITALSIPLLGEKVGPRRWAATFVGLLGVLIVVRPGTEAFQPASILPLVAALTWASAVVVTRRTSAGDTALTTLAYSAIIGWSSHSSPSNRVGTAGLAHPRFWNANWLRGNSRPLAHRDRVPLWRCFRPRTLHLYPTRLVDDTRCHIVRGGSGRLDAPGGKRDRSERTLHCSSRAGPCSRETTR